MDLTFFSIVTVCLLCGLAAFIDSIAGDGGLISLPAYLMIGLPAQFAAGSNKFSACIGSSVAIARFAKSGKIQWSQALVGMSGALIGSFAGTSLATWLPEHLLKLAIVGALPFVAVFLFLKKMPKDAELAESPLPFWKSTFISLIIGLIFGAYDGLVGPGTGTFIILASIALLHIDMVTASANAKVINFASNISSLAVFAYHGNVVLRVALPAAVFTIIGNFLGVKYCLKYGSKGVRKMLFIVLALLFTKLIIDLCSYIP